ncbi:acetylornithine deacetylase/succinyl-diaminopimelate desuccinylase-like protein [Spinactinospora alkalitolerans]|uniref:Acetylornithine deacetylase/succinyl-diaminopimelate desuccinylase-like protein n=1 Tax=Spinactinospora alkalitolerans TaxID=687207 RepID=A0A852U3V6_9ACTN|nr:M20/M25/M40 family metallo-hydrolase [Spinactinospora alkalitolerans]NYE48794.1 acetylornithine deacetylase/succinyl-diaminopimelate desuccinylase-like protein [Spinactinospora alkalitolerans]
MAEPSIGDRTERRAHDRADDRAAVDDEVVRFTSELIRIDTTNRGGGDCRERPAAEYVAERLAEAGLEPAVLESAPGRANVVARVAGSDPSAPALLVHGHLDVVPADPSQWRVHPFSGEVRDGMVWGRGAIDMKNANAMVLSVVRAWARAGRRPRRDIVLAFTADEEDSAAYGADWLVREHAGLFDGCTEGISESGAYTYHARTTGGDPVRIYPVGAGERGTAWLRLTARGTAGHGSKTDPGAVNAVSELAAAVTRIADHRWPVRLTPTTRAALTEIGAAVGVKVDLEAPGFDPQFDVDAVLERLGPAAALVRSTVRNSTNPTVLDAGYKVNVIPESAGAGVDGRMLPGAEEEFTAALDELTGPRVDWEFAHRSAPLTAPVETPTFAAMRAALLAHDPGAHVVPVCLSGGTDAKQFAELGITGYGFSPLRLPPSLDYGALFHGVDERVPVDALRFGTRVLDAFLSAVD